MTDSSCLGRSLMRNLLPYHLASTYLGFAAVACWQRRSVVCYLLPIGLLMLHVTMLARPTDRPAVAGHRHTASRYVQQLPVDPVSHPHVKPAMPKAPCRWPVLAASYLWTTSLPCVKPPGADPHARWCGGRRAPGYPIWAACRRKLAGDDKPPQWQSDQCGNNKPP